MGVDVVLFSKGFILPRDKEKIVADNVGMLRTDFGSSRAVYTVYRVPLPQIGVDMRAYCCCVCKPWCIMVIILLYQVCMMILLITLLRVSSKHRINSAVLRALLYKK